MFGFIKHFELRRKHFYSINMLYFALRSHHRHAGRGHDPVAKSNFLGAFAPNFFWSFLFHFGLPDALSCTKRLDYDSHFFIFFYLYAFNGLL